MQMTTAQITQMMNVNTNVSSSSSKGTVDNTFEGLMQDKVNAEAKGINTENVVLTEEEALALLEQEQTEEDENAEQPDLLGELAIAQDVLQMLKDKLLAPVEQETQETKTDAIVLIASEAEGQNTDKVASLTGIENGEAQTENNVLKAQTVTEAKTSEIKTSDAKSSETSSEFQGMLNSQVDTHNTNVQNVQKTENVPQTSQTMSTEYVSEIKDEIANKILSGVKEFEIELNPSDLGKLTIKATYEDGQAMISIICTEKDTLGILSKSATDLANIIELRSGNATQIVIDEPRSDYLDNNADSPNERNDQTHEQNSNEKIEIEEAESFLHQLRLGLM